MSQLKSAAFRVRLLFVRHAESQMNTAAHLLGGQHNHVPLTAKGQLQATLLGQRFIFDKTRFDQIYTSTAVRAKTTCEIALRTANLTNACPITHSESLLEQNQGEWEGKERIKVYTEIVHQEMLDQQLDFSAPGGESLRDVQNRSVKFMSGEIDKLKKKSEDEKREIVVGVFSHGGCIRVLLQHYCGFHAPWTWLITQDNTCMNEILLDSRGTATLRLNDTAHLKYTMATPQLAESIQAISSSQSDVRTSTDDEDTDGVAAPSPASTIPEATPKL